MRTWINALVTVALLFGLTVSYLSLQRRITSAPLRILLMFAFPVLLAAVTAAASGRFAGLFTAENIPRQLLVGVAVFAALLLIIAAIGKPFGMRLRDLYGTAPISRSELVLRLIYLLIFVGFSEEIVFRGYFFEQFKTLTGSGVWAIIISSALFGLWHYPNGHSWAQVGVTALIGAFYATAYIKFEYCTLLSLALAHGLHDAFGVVLRFYTKSGG